jgi:hypothetical protein
MLTQSTPLPPTPTSSHPAHANLPTSPSLRPPRPLPNRRVRRLLRLALSRLHDHGSLRTLRLHLHRRPVRRRPRILPGSRPRSHPSGPGQPPPHPLSASPSSSAVPFPVTLPLYEVATSVHWIPSVMQVLSKPLLLISWGRKTPLGMKAWC